MELQIKDHDKTQPVRILLVDDQKEILQVMQLILTRQHDYCVETASSGQQALQKAENFAPDVVVSDITMPEMDGCEMMTQLRNDSSLAPFKAIALSGYGGDHDDLTRAAGYDVHLMKPVDYDTLTKIIEELVYEKVNVSP